MSYKQINTRMSEENKDVIVRKFREVDTIFDPVAVNLTTEERRSIPKMGVKKVGFAESTLGYARNNPQYVPSYHNIDELTANMEFVKQLQDVLEVLDPIYEKIKDTYMAVGAEVFLASRVFYDSVKAGAKQGIPGSDVIAKELGIIFKRSRLKSKEKTGNTDADTDTGKDTGNKN